MSLTSIMYYDNILPMHSSDLKYPMKFDYNLSNKGPMELSIRDYEFFSVKQGHAVVAYKLYQDANNSSIYYLELYDNVAPGSSSFVKIEKCPIKMFGDLEEVGYVLLLDALEYDWDNTYCTLDVVDMCEKYVK